MWDILTQLGAGFLACLHPVTLLMLVAGIVVGLLVGVLPGLTLVMGVVLFLPFTYQMDITPAITHRFHFTDHQVAFATARGGNSGKIILDWIT